ncbi:hypothetical protein GCM10010413_15230 [Promicromonospora sukumoe]
MTAGAALREHMVDPKLHPPAPPGRIASVNGIRLPREVTLDANGTQVLTGRHLQRAHDP